MRIAWFRHVEFDAADPFDSTAAIVDELRTAHDITAIVETNAHDFVWQHLQRPWDLCVFELDNTRGHQFIWGYLPTYPGVVLMHGIDVPHVRVAMTAARAVVVGDRGLAESLEERFPDAHVRFAPASAGPGRSAPHNPKETGDAASGADPFLQSRSREAPEAAGPPPVRFAVFDERPHGRALIDRAFHRARRAGAAFDVVDPDAPARMLSHCDIAIAPGWPPFRTRSTPRLAAMAAGKAVVTMETEAMAEWPAIDPQTWRPRGFGVNDAPVAVTVDPRDEEHSLMLAVRRLSTDAMLREQLGRAARAWWERYATPARAAHAWAAILDEAATLFPPPRPADWPKQFLVDGTELAREILDEFGLSSDLYSPSPDPASRIPDPGSDASHA